MSRLRAAFPCAPLFTILLADWADECHDSEGHTYRAPAMQFTLYGVRYDTDAMRAFPTDDPAEPIIYIDEQARVFVTRLDQGKAVIHWASHTEIKRLSDRHRLRELGDIAASDPPRSWPPDLHK